MDHPPRGEGDDAQRPFGIADLLDEVERQAGCQSLDVADDPGGDDEAELRAIDEHARETIRVAKRLPDADGNIPTTMEQIVAADRLLAAACGGDPALGDWSFLL